MYELVQVSEKCYYINCPAKIGVYVADGENVYLVDSGNDKDAGRKVRQILDKNGWHLTAILNTHSNADHIGGNRYLQGQTGCKVYSGGIEAAFTKYPVLEPSFLYGGYPCKDLRHKFLMAQESDVADFSDESFPKEIEVIPLPGHFFDMVGFRMPDNVVFLADCISSRETLDKYAVSFIYDVGAYLETLDKVEQMEAAVEGEIKMLMKGNPQMALDLTVTADGESENVKMWLQGDWVYAQSGEETFKMEVGQEYADLLEASADKNNSAFSLLFVEDVDKKVSGDEVTYTMELNNGLENMVNGIFAQAFQAAGLSESMMGKMNVQAFTIRYVVKGGTLKSASADAAMSMTISEDETAGTAMLGLIMEMKMDVSASGSAVKISFPDFSGFEEVIGAADGPTAILGTTAA